MPATMPGTVRAAQVLFFVMTGLVALGVMVAALAGDPELAGGLLGANFPVIGGVICAFCFGKSGNGAKVTAIVFASLMIAAGLGALGQRQPAGLVEFAMGTAIVVLLSQRQSGQWFRREPRF
ncbi:hypothetical protein ABT174_15135 [Streptomyces sparsogenes]|uniref:hypothetical protein n=1 Tax=Streptomyces sparsogenes TaxID=67365 RepID=UPI0033235E05